MTHVRFITPTLLDPRSITVMGLNVKPNSPSPIGYFGTGLKYAIAVCARLGIPITIWIGTTEYSFDAKQRDFRGSEYQAVRMRKRAVFKKWSYTDLPFTTQYGRDWKLWQVLRELESNTRDEGGKSVIANEPFTMPSTLDTVIIVEDDEFVKAYREIDKVFLPKGLTKYMYGDPTLEVFQAKSDHLYYRGMRVADLPKTSLLTYNILDRLDLTEDRTVKYMWDAQYRIAHALSKLVDRAKINHLLNAKEDDWEASLPFDELREEPSQEFLGVLNSRFRRSQYIPSGTLPRLASLRERFHTTATATTIPVSERLQAWLYEYLDKGALNQESEDLIDEAIRALKESGK